MAIPTYWDYLKLEELLGLQGGLEEDETGHLPDELHFIVVHQVFELWFKLILRELRLARDHLVTPEVPEETIPYVVHHLTRVNEILKNAVDQFRIMETLTPQDFLDFRDKLVPASGFQSFQMREIEILMGLDLGDFSTSGAAASPLSHIKKSAGDSAAGARIVRRIETAIEQPSLRAALHDWLYRTPIQGTVPGDPADEEHVQQFVDDYLRAFTTLQEGQAARLKEISGPAGLPDAVIDRSETIASATEFLNATDMEPEARKRMQRIRAALVFIESYRTLPLLAWPRLLLDTIVESEELMVLFRTRHARMVERVIGRRAGTGGSSGVDYLDRTTRYRIFTELWAVRTVLLPKSDLPPLRNADAYGFAR